MKVKGKATTALFLPDGSVHLLCRTDKGHSLIPIPSAEYGAYLPLSGKGAVAWLEKNHPEIESELLGSGKEGRWAKVLRKATEKEQHAACLAMLNFYRLFEQPTDGAILFLLVFLAQVMDIALPHLPGVPVVQLGSLTSIPAALRVLVRLFCGPEKWSGEGWYLKRPACLEAAVTLGEAVPSLSPETYLGGRFKDWCEKRRRFWLPCWNQAVIFSSNLPHAVAETIVGASPLMTPILCGNMHQGQLKGRPLLNAQPQIVRTAQKSS